MMKRLKNKLFGLLAGIYYPLKELLGRVAYYWGDKLARGVVVLCIIFIAILLVLKKFIAFIKKLFTRKGEEDSV